jgi:hypothetical protein
MVAVAVALAVLRSNVRKKKQVHLKPPVPPAMPVGNPKATPGKGVLAHQPAFNWAGSTRERGPP